MVDASGYWYSAKVVNVEPYKRGMKIHYDGFDERWDEWITLKQNHRIAPHKTRSLGRGQGEGGVHVLLATKFGKSKDGEKLRGVLEVYKLYMLFSSLFK